MTLDRAYWTALADDYAAAAPGALGHDPPRWALVMAMCCAEHETNNSRAWPGTWNFGAVQLRTLTPAELALYAAGQLHEGDYTRDTHRADVPRGGLHVDTHPGPSGPQPYPVWFAAFDSRVQGIAFFLRVLWRLSSVTIPVSPVAGPGRAHIATLADVAALELALQGDHTGAAELPNAGFSSLARAMYRHGYFEGSHHGARPVGQRVDPLIAPEQSNVDDYATAMARCLGSIGTALDAWDTPWHAALTEDVHGGPPEPPAAA